MKTMSPEVIASSVSGDLEPVPESPNATFTRRADEGAIARSVRRVVERARLVAAADDIAIVYQVRERDASDIGERVTVEEFAESFGFNPADLDS